VNMSGKRPEWLTFDCYGTLIQWDEGLLAAVEAILAKQGRRSTPRRSFTPTTNTSTTSSSSGRTSPSERSQVKRFGLR
jgi:FMN phosphatase YigB (HAD superfamily)